MPATDSTAARAAALAANIRIDVMGAQVRGWLAAAGIDCLLLKGRAFADRLYDGASERPYSDTDLLVPVGDRARAERLLGEHGYRRVDRDGDRLGAAGYAHTFAGADGTLVDLHWNLSGVSAAPALTWSLLRAHSRELSVGGRPARVPDDAATALVVTLHQAHHGARWTTAGHDLDRAVKRIGLSAWSTAARLAGQLGADEAFAAGLALSAEGRALARELGIRGELTLEYRMRAENESYATWALHRLLHAPSGRARVGVLREILVPPPHTMRLFFPLATRGRAGLAAAYLVRPLRLAAGAAPALLGYLRARRTVAASSES